MNNKIKKELLQHSVDGRISCAEARNIAERLGIAYKEIGEVANALKIKIADCQLGCF